MLSLQAAPTCQPDQRLQNMARKSTRKSKAPATRTALEPADNPPAKQLWVGDRDERRRRAERARQERVAASTANRDAIQLELDAGPIYSGVDLLDIARLLRETAQALRSSSPFDMYCQRAAVLAATAIRCGVLDGPEYTTARSAIRGGYTSFAYAIAEVVKLATTNSPREPEIAACEWLAGVVKAAADGGPPATPLVAKPEGKEPAANAVTSLVDGGTRSNESNEEDPPSLTKSQSLVLKTMAVSDPARLLSAEAISREMDAPERLSPRTIGPILQRLIGLDLAERPQGTRSGARLTLPGRRLASKIAD